VSARERREQAAKPARAAKLSYKETQELQALPGRIEALEREQAQVEARLADPELYRADSEQVKRVRARYAQIEEELTQALERWTALEERAR
jgi:ATP-binding cassette subfamily F protein uup